MNSPTVRSLGTLRNCGCAECKAELAYRLGDDGDLYRDPMPTRLASTSVGDTDWVAYHADHMRRFPHSKATPALLKEGAEYDGPRHFGLDRAYQPDLFPEGDARVSEERYADTRIRSGKPVCPSIYEALQESHLYE